MLKQFYKRKSVSFLTWGPLCVLLLSPYIIVNNGFLGMKLYRNLTYSTYSMSFFFPLFGLYSLSSLQYFQKGQVIFRFGSFKNAWKKCSAVLLLDSILYVLFFHISAFMCYILKQNFSFYLDNKGFFLQSFLAQCLTAYAFELTIMTLSLLSRNSLLGFFSGYLLLWLEKLIQVIFPTWNTFSFLAGIDWDSSMGLLTIHIMFGITVGLLVSVPVCFANRDYLKDRGEEL